MKSLRSSKEETTSVDHHFSIETIDQRWSRCGGRTLDDAIFKGRRWGFVRNTAKLCV